jgi:ABC-2 type transport system ATP-binding protein
MFQIDFKSRKAVYDQIVDSFTRLVNTGVLKPGEMLPTIQEMSKQLTVNPNTVQKAYLELENRKCFFTENGEEWYIPAATEEEGENKHTEVAGLYGRLHADIRELILRGEVRENIASMLGMGEKSYIELDNVTKTFDGVTALRGMNLHVRKGSIYGLVGVNGSGKTTALKHIAGIYRQDDGRVRIEGIPVMGTGGGSAATHTIGYMPEDLYFLPGYNMKMMRDFFRSKHFTTWNDMRYDELVALFKLNQDQRLSTFSPGMQKKAGFIYAVCTMPDILLLDETIDGLDPMVRRHVFRQIIADVSDRQMTVIVTSHNLRELDGLCDTIGILKDGHMVIERDLDELKANVHKISVAFAPSSEATRYPYDGLEVLHMEESGTSDLLVVQGKADEIEAHIKAFQPLMYDHLPITLEEIFMYETEADSNEDD